MSPELLIGLIAGGSLALILVLGFVWPTWYGLGSAPSAPKIIKTVPKFDAGSNDDLYKGNGQMTEIYAQAIKKAFEEYYVTTVVEVGTWNGQGSTVQLMNALKGNQSAEIHTIESNYNRMVEAQDFWRKQASGPQIHFHHGVLHRKVASEWAIPPHQFIGFMHEEERKAVEESPLLELPLESVDAILLDGGEYTTTGDYEVLLKLKPSVIILDDTMVYKTNKIRQALLESYEWKVLEDWPESRNGFAIFGKVQDNFSGSRRRW
jgi:hypothetical protein